MPQPPSQFLQIACSTGIDGHIRLYALDNSGMVWFFEWSNYEDHTLGTWRPLDATRAAT